MLTWSHLLLHKQHNIYSLDWTIITWIFNDEWNTSEKQIPVWLSTERNRNNTPYCVIKMISKQAKCWTFLSCYSFMTKTWSALLDHAYSACLTRTNDGRPSAYMLTAVSRPHPGNDCVINPEPFFKLLLTAEGENGTQTVSAHLSPKHHWGWFDPSSLSVIVKDRARTERDHVHAQIKSWFILLTGEIIFSLCFNINMLHILH